MTVLIDSWAWVEYWKGGKDAPKAAEQIEGTEEAVWYRRSTWPRYISG